MDIFALFLLFLLVLFASLCTVGTLAAMIFLLVTVFAAVKDFIKEIK